MEFNSSHTKIKVKVTNKVASNLYKFTKLKRYTLFSTKFHRTRIKEVSFEDKSGQSK